ncbi:MAG: hypothetical protein CL855_01635 [Cryomorphaceae bacterium]|nr:hypothetical protein [Cryomorphaceae bacterium]|tara:strand:- start:525 stop:1076 length:552 start_codon:yes stop_codon:yes gene_type:complete
MKKLLVLLVISTVLSSCAHKVVFCDELKSEFNISDEDKMKGVQFFTSHTIILNQHEESTNSNMTDESGVLVSTSTSNSESIIIPANTKCIFHSYGPDNTVNIRFEDGENKFLTFKTKWNKPLDRYYLDANWVAKSGPELTYDNKIFKVDMMRAESSKDCFLRVLRKGIKKNKRKDRVINGMKV